MFADLKLAIGAAVLGGFFVVAAHTGAPAALPVDPLALNAEETQQFKVLIDPATFDGTAVTALVAWLELLRDNYPDPGVIGEISLDLAVLVEDDHPYKDTILALIQDMLATAAGPQLGVVPTNSLNLGEYPCTDNPSPICN